MIQDSVARNCKKGAAARRKRIQRAAARRKNIQIQMQRRDAVPFLEHLLTDRLEHPITRHEAAEALGAISSPGSSWPWGVPKRPRRSWSSRPRCVRRPSVVGMLRRCLRSHLLRGCSPPRANSTRPPSRPHPFAAPPVAFQVSRALHSDPRPIAPPGDTSADGRPGRRSPRPSTMPKIAHFLI